MSAIDMFFVQYGLLAVFVIMLLKTVGVPFPIPGDVIIFAAAVRVAQGKLVGWQVFFAILLALLLGGLVQYALARGAGRGLLMRFGRFVGLTQPRVDAVARKIQAGGVPGLALAILIPGIRGIAITAAGLANMPPRRFLTGLTLGSLFFLSLHFFLGYLGGSALAAVSKILPLPLVITLVPALLILAYVLWLIAFRWQKRQRVEGATALELWHEGICPACLTLYSLYEAQSSAEKPAQVTRA